MFHIKEKSREVTNMGELKEQPIKWIWYPYIPSGKLTVVHGAADSGKTVFACRLMAAFTNRKSLDGMENHPPGNVLYFSADDDLSDMVRPRLVEAGADLSRIFAVHDMLPFTLADDSTEKLIEDYRIGMMIVDPVQEYLEYDVYRDGPDFIYPVLHKLERLAKHTGCAMILTAYSDGHGSETGNTWKKEFADKISSVLCMERPDMGTKKCRLVHEKCLLAPEGETRIFPLASGQTV